MREGTSDDAGASVHELLVLLGELAAGTSSYVAALEMGSVSTVLRVGLGSACSAGYNSYNNGIWSSVKDIPVYGMVDLPRKGAMMTINTRVEDLRLGREG